MRRHFRIPAEWASRQVRLHFDGMDYTGAVWLDGKFLGIHEGMFGGPTFNVSKAVAPAQEHELLVRLIHETDQTKVFKAWAIDGRGYYWSNQFRSFGLWRSIRLVSSGRAYMEAPWVRTERLGQASASLWAQIMIINEELPFQGAIQARIADGHRLSRRTYWVRALKSLSDPAARQKWQAVAVGDPLNTKGPWLKPQIENVPTTVAAQVVGSKVIDHELRLTVNVRNTGANPAYPVHLAITPDAYSVLWSDDYFWLAPGESVTLAGIVRLDMTGLDPLTNPPVATASDLTLSVSAWNAAALTLGVGNR